MIEIEFNLLRNATRARAENRYEEFLQSLSKDHENYVRSKLDPDFALKVDGEVIITSNDAVPNERPNSEIIGTHTNNGLSMKKSFPMKQLIN